MRPTCSTSSATLSPTRKPGIDSSLSSVPPVCASPRPESLATGMPIAAASGASAIVVLSPTPPVECLSTTVRPSDERSIVAPESIMACVSSLVSVSESPRKTTAIDQALICSGATRPATKPSTSHVISPGACTAPSRLRSISSTALTATGVPGRPSPAARAEPGRGGRADVGELAVVTPARPAARHVSDQQRVLARVVGRGGRRIAAVIRGQQQQVVRAERGAQIGDGGVDLLQAAVEALGIVAVPVGHVGLDEVDEDEPRAAARGPVRSSARGRRRSSASGATRRCRSRRRRR